MGDKPADDQEIHETWQYVPGALVRHTGRSDWGLGQVQSSIGHRVTVNFQNAGKQMIDARVVKLEVVDGG